MDDWIGVIKRRDESRKNIASYLKKLIDSDGRSYKLIANRIGMQESDLRRYVGNPESMTVDIISDIALSLGVEMSSSLGGK